MENKLPKYYILKAYNPKNVDADENGCYNLFFMDIENGKDISCYSIKNAKKYNKIGEAMAEAGHINQEGKIKFKVIPIY